MKSSDGRDGAFLFGFAVRLLEIEWGESIRWDSASIYPKLRRFNFKKSIRTFTVNCKYHE